MATSMVEKKLRFRSRGLLAPTIIFSKHKDVPKVMTFPEGQGHKRKVCLVVRIGATLFNTLFQCNDVLMNAVIH